MAPHANHKPSRQNNSDILDNDVECASTSPSATRKLSDAGISNSESSIECVLQPRVLTDFSYMEQPIRCSLTCQGKQLTGNGKNAVFLRNPDDDKDPNSHANRLADEYTILPQADGSVLLQHTKTHLFLCSSKKGQVYVSGTRGENFEKWTMTEAPRDDNGSSGTSGFHYVLSSIGGSNRCLACSGNTVHTIRHEDCNTTDANNTVWKIHFISGELGFLSMPLLNRRVRCNLVGGLSLSDNYQGWEAWRFTEVGDGHVRISPWAHSELSLSSNDKGNVCTTEKRGCTEIWNVTRASNGLDGLIIQSVQTGRVLRYDQNKESFGTIPHDALHINEFCVWDFESLHRQVYYLATADNAKRLEAAKRGLTTRRLPSRVQSEEWKIVKSNATGDVLLFSMARQQYLISNADGEASLVASPLKDGSELWNLEDQEDGLVIRSKNTKRVLVAPKHGPISTVEPGTRIMGNARWKLEPRIPRQVNKDKLKAVGGAVAVGIIGTVATPFLIGGAIGALGIAQVGVAGQVAIGSVRAVEAVNTFTRVTLSSSQLMISQSSSLSSDSKNEIESVKEMNRPFCAWRSWQ